MSKIKTLAILATLFMVNGAAQAMTRGDVAKPLLKEGALAPCVVLTGIKSNGVEEDKCIREPNFKAQRYTVLKFFSVHCSACARLHKQFVQHFSTHSRLLDKAAMNYIGIDRNESQIRQYARSKVSELSSLEATVFLDNDRDAKDSYHVRQTPTVYVLDTRDDFRIVYKHEGSMSVDDLQRFTDVLLK